MRSFRHFTPLSYLIIAVSLALSAVLGCAAKDAQLEEKLRVFKEVSTFMRDNRISGQVSLAASGDGAAYARQSFGLDTGISIHAGAQFNAARGDTVESPTDAANPVAPASQPADDEE